MSLTNEIVLRPRFTFEVQTHNEILLKGFEDQSDFAENNYIVTRVDNHIFIKINKKDQHFWSPQLHLEITDNGDNNSIVKGLFGPNPTVWTMFMFFHFVVAALFFGLGVWAYTNFSLGNSYAIQVFLSLLMIVLWFTLYFAGRIGRTKGMPEMRQLHHFMKETVRTYR
ncbi:GTP-binding protein [Winogradskyella sediminis]|uniref:GTP-binding protein n=1 Tax=Winogradskyella sediminis TaxID=1382466 RepID=UPI000E276326|nr:GTP-binding protein [Winogradskyella sediminis]REG87532.1 hypothetical protein C8N41_102371 [Winogradskyella sediminis]